MSRINTLYLVIGLVIAALVSLSVYGWLFWKVKSTSAEVSRIENQIELEAQREQRLNSVQSLVDDLNTEFGELDSRFLSSDGVVGFLERLEGLGGSAGTPVEVNSVNILEKSHPRAPDEWLQVEFAAEGEWSSLLQFVRLTETLPYSTQFNRIQLERVPTSGARSVWRGHMTFLIAKLK